MTRPLHIAPWALALAAALAAVLVYANTLGNGFVWDDTAIVSGNPDTRDLGNVPRLLFSPDEVKPYYRPLNRISYLLDYQVFGMRPAGFHAVNVALHAASAALLFFAARRLFRRDGPAVFAALLFAVHPLNAEAVNFVSGRNNAMALAFMLGSLLVFARAAERGSHVLAAASGGLWLAALLSKEPAALLPLLLVLLLRWPVLGEFRWSGPRRLLLFVPHAVAAIVYAGMRSKALGGPLGAASASDAAGLIARLAVNLETIPRYLSLAVFPARLAVHHPLEGVAPWMVIVWIGLAAAGWAAVRWGGPPVRAGLAWAALSYVPIANLVPIPSGALAERFAYLPAVGLWVAAAGLAALVWTPGRARSLAVAAGIVVAVLGARAVVRNADWRDDVRLMQSLVRAYPDTARAHFDLGSALRDTGDLDGAVRSWRAALVIDPRHAPSLVQLGTVAAVAGDLKEAERLYREALASDAAQPLALFNLGQVLERTGRTAEAVAAYRQFLRVAASPYLDFVPRARERVEALGGIAEPASAAGH